MKLQERLCKLLEVKSLVTFALIGTLCLLALRQNTVIPGEMYTAVVTAVITYFFTRQKGEDKRE